MSYVCVDTFSIFNIIFECNQSLTVGTDLEKCQLLGLKSLFWMPAIHTYRYSGRLHLFWVQNICTFLSNNSFENCFLTEFVCLYGIIWWSNSKVTKGLHQSISYCPSRIQSAKLQHFWSGKHFTFGQEHVQWPFVFFYYVYTRVMTFKISLFF